jgi:hypothetical protein
MNTKEAYKLAYGQLRQQHRQGQLDYSLLDKAFGFKVASRAIDSLSNRNLPNVTILNWQMKRLLLKIDKGVM